MESQIKKMNEAAMAAYMNDLASPSDFTSKLINEKAEAAAARAASAAAGSSSSNYSSSGSKPTIGPKVDPLAIALPEDIVERKQRELKKLQNKKESLWCEAVTDEGHTYYWNIKTGESVWVEPKEGYMSYKEYQEIQQIGEQQAAKIEREEFVRTVKNSDEIAAALKREQHKKIGEKIKKKEREQAKREESTENSKVALEDPETAARPLGRWEAVETKQ